MIYEEFIINKRNHVCEFVYLQCFWTPLRGRLLGSMCGRAALPDSQAGVRHTKLNDYKVWGSLLLMSSSARTGVPSSECFIKNCGKSACSVCLALQGSSFHIQRAPVLSRSSLYCLAVPFLMGVSTIMRHSRKSCSLLLEIFEAKQGGYTSQHTYRNVPAHHH